MSESIGPVAFAAERDEFGRPHFSAEVAAKIDKEVSKIIDDAKKRAHQVLVDHRKALDSIAKKLVEVETLERADFEQLLVLNGIEPKKSTEGIVIGPEPMDGE